ncbi:DUF6392 family protein [Cobetia marina]|uniref:DUF6392 family protein n=1 Tax=Cobetia marina TaxID=28258 RepID=UPI003A9554FC
MDAATIERWIKNLGRPYDVLIAEGVIPNMPLQELYKGRDWIDIEPADGLELSFRAETKRFERLFITLLKSTPSTVEFKGELPKPFTPAMSQAQVRANFGEPMESQGPTKLPLNTVVGGFDAYLLDPATHPQTKVVFQYTAALMVDTMVFALNDTGHD